MESTDTDSKAVASPRAVVGGRPPVLALSSAPGYLLRRAQQVHTAIWAEYVQLELTGPQYGVLASLAQEPLADQRRLGELASLDKNSTTDIVRRLSRRGWIRRSVDTADQRRRMLELTPAAKVAMRQITPAVQRVQDALLELVPAQGQEALVRMLYAIAYQQGEQPSPAVPSDPLPIVSLSRAPGYLIRRSQRVHGTVWARHVGTELTGPQYAVLAALASEPVSTHPVKGAKRGPKPRLGVEDQLLMLLMYYREYRTFVHVGASFGVSETQCWRVVTDLEARLLSDPRFHLERKQALRGDTRWQGVVIDVGECAVERPKKSSVAATRARRSVTP